MSSFVKNIRTKNYQNLVIGFQVTVENVGDVFRDTVYSSTSTSYYVNIVGLHCSSTITKAKIPLWRKVANVNHATCRTTNP